jgi:prepilin-type N-terminal cleavage/methylation domain-containing protein
MFFRKDGKLSSKGQTLIELLVVVSIMGIITPSVILIFIKMRQGMAADEMHLRLQTLNEQTLSRVHERILQSRHLFQAPLPPLVASDGTSFSTAISITASDPPTLVGSKMAVAQTIVTNTMAPSQGANRAFFGDCLLMGCYDTSQTITKSGAATAYLAPISIYGAGISQTVVNGAVTSTLPATIVLDAYRFYYYYLSTQGVRQVKNATDYNLEEWQSVQYADYRELADMPNTVVQNMAATWLANPPTASGYKAITVAWDPDATDPTQAFYQLSNSGLGTTPLTGYKILEAQPAVNLTQVSSGILSNGFNYGISGNTSSFVGSPAVPLYANASAPFPGGFEVGLTGSGTGLEVFIRSLVIASGASGSGGAWNDNSIVTNARDVW